MTGGKAISDPLYHMTLNVTSREIGLGITVTEASPVYSIIVQATFTVKRAGTEEVLVTGTANASASYNYVNQIYANTRAKIDAEDRAAEQVGNQIAIRVAAADRRGKLRAPSGGGRGQDRRYRPFPRRGTTAPSGCSSSMATTPAWSPSAPPPSSLRRLATRPIRSA